MYWADWGSTPRVERAQLDGSLKHLMYIDSDSYLTNGVHVQNGTLYVCDVQGQRNVDKRSVYVKISTSTSSTLSTAIDQGGHCYHLEGNETSLFISDMDDNLLVAPLSAPNRGIRVPGQPTGGNISAIFHHNGGATTQPNPCAGVTCEANKMCLPSGTTTSCKCLRGKTGPDCSQTVLRRTTPSVMSSTSDSLHFITGDPNTWIKTRRTSTFELSSHGPYSYFDIDVRNQTVYYYVQSHTAIYAHQLSTSDDLKIVVATNVISCRGMAYDWKNHALYFTSGLVRKGIFKVDLAANSTRLILSRSVDSPRGIAVDPFRAKIYWCDSGSDRLEIADLDGGNRRTLLRNFFSVRDVAIDYGTHMLYAVDLDAIYRINLDGSNKTRIAYEFSGITRAIDVYDNYIFIAYGSLMGGNYVRIYEKDTGLARSQVARGSTVNDVRVNSMTRQPDTYIIPSTIATTRGPTTPRPPRTTWRPRTTTSVSGSCGAQLRGSGGYFTSPNYPGDYPNNAFCSWTITAPSGQRVRLTFSAFRLESQGLISTRCTYDYLTVYTSPTSSGRRYCGRTRPPTLTSTGNVMRLTLTSDGSVNYMGFSAFWLATGATVPPTTPMTTVPPLRGDFLLLALKTSSATAQIWAYYVTTGYWHRLPLNETKDVRGVGWDPATRRVFWSDVDAAHIMSAGIDGSNQKVETNVTGLVDGLYVEPSSRLLFFTNANGGTITARHLTKGTESEVLDHDIGAPRGLAVDFATRWLYWADWGGSPRIEKAQLDGSSKTTLHQEQSSEYTNGIHFDQASKRLFFCDNQEKDDNFYMHLVEISPISGDVKKRNVFEGYFCMHLSGNSTHLFISDILKGVYVTGLDSLAQLTRLQSVPPAVAYYAVFYVSVSGPRPGPDPCASTSCTSNTQMCIPAQKGTTCVCQAGWTGDSCVTVEDYDSYPAIFSSTKENFEYIVGDPAHWLKTLSAATHQITSAAHQLRYAFDFNVKQKLMYYCVDYKFEFIIKSTDISVQISEPLTVASQLPGCNGLAYNWKNQDLYMTSSGKEVGIFRINSTLKSSTKLVSGNMEKPIGIAMDPFNEHIYWCDAGTGRVERVDLQGKNRVTVANITGVTDIVIDFDNDKLYVSAGSSVYWLERDGSHLAEFAEEEGEQVVALTLSQSHVFLGTQHSAGSYINIYNKMTGAVVRHLQRAGKMTDIGFYGATRQPDTPHHSFTAPVVTLTTPTTPTKQTTSAIKQTTTSPAITWPPKTASPPGANQPHAQDKESNSNSSSGLHIALVVCGTIVIIVIALIIAFTVMRLRRMKPGGGEPAVRWRENDGAIISEPVRLSDLSGAENSLPAYSEQPLAFENPKFAEVMMGAEGATGGDDTSTM